MKRPFIRLVQYAIALSLIFGWVYFQTVKNDKELFSDIYNHFKKRMGASVTLEKLTSRLAESAVHSVEKSPNQKPFITQIEKIQTIFEQPQHDLSDITFESHEIIINSKYQEEYFLISFNTTSRTRELIKNGTINRLSEHITHVLDTLETLIVLSDEYQHLPEKQISDYHLEQRLLFDNKSELLQLVSSSKRFSAFIKNYDTIHLLLLLGAVEHDLRYLEHQLIENIVTLLSNQYIPKSKNTFMMAYEKQPVIGAPFTVSFFPTSYIVSDSIKIELNGKDLAVKDGIAKFDYTPKTTEAVRFSVKMTSKNPYTGKIDNFRKNFKKEIAH